MPITPLGNSATGTEIATAVNALITLSQDSTSGIAALAAKVNSATIGNTVLGTKMTEVYDQFSLPSESPATPAAPTIPTYEMNVTISAVARKFKFRVARFIYDKVTYLSTDITTAIAAGSGDAYTAAVALITAMVAAGSVVIDGEGSGILLETT